MKKIKKKIVRKKIKKKERKIYIPERQKILLKTISDNIRKGMSMEQAMISVGYSKQYAKSSTQLKNTDAWKKLVGKELDDKLLIKVHKELLKNEEWRARDAGLDKAYKLKGKYNEITIRHKFGDKSDAELEEELASEISENFGIEEGDNQAPNK